MKRILFVMWSFLISFSCKNAVQPNPPNGSDTTSHAIAWQVDTLGVGGSILYDITIINDTLAYAVGEMYLRNDTTGQLDPIPYNMAKWDGNRWHIMRIQFYTICGQSSRTPYPAKSVFAFGANDIWIAMNGDQVVRWNGTTQTSTMCLPVSFSINKLWGENANSVYAVGAGGNIMHYTNGTWQRVESGTTLNINDIWGSPTGQNGAQTILCVASNGDPNLGSKILQINGTTVTSLNTSGLSWDVNGIWFVPEQSYYVVGAGVHKKGGLSEAQWYRFPPGAATSFSSSGVRGNAANDVFVVGSFGEVVHYNGLTWKVYFPSSSRVFGRVSVKKNLVVAAGFDGTSATALIGRR